MFLRGNKCEAFLCLFSAQFLLKACPLFAFFRGHILYTDLVRNMPNNLHPHLLLKLEKKMLGKKQESAGNRCLPLETWEGYITNSGYVHKLGQPITATAIFFLMLWLMYTKNECFMPIVRILTLICSGQECPSSEAVDSSNKTELLY